MSRSLPVVVPSIPIFHEVAGEAGVFFNPESSVEFAEAVKSLETSAHWQEASARGLSRSTLFDWNLSATKLLSLIESLRR
jgi:glycosyltransferase involved in cell wall biosynthesis